jgi:sec-independent protein translocase protein TatA
LCPAPAFGDDDQTAVSFRPSREEIMPTLGPIELIIILVIFLLFFGAGKLGDLGGALRKSVKDFKTNAGFDDAQKPDENKPAKG